MGRGGDREAPRGHDQLFKQLLRAFFADFLRLFDPETAGELDLDTLEFRDTEAFTDIPQGERRTADLVVQVRTIGGMPRLLLIHVEVQRERELRFPWRMWQYYSLLRQREDLPVIPVALVLYPGREGIALEEYTETVFGRTYLVFRYLQISLPRLDAVEYVQTGGVLGAALASAMRLPAEREAQIGVHLAGLRRVREAFETGYVDEARAFLVVNLIATYLPLSNDERDALQVQLEQQGDTTLEATELTWADHLVLQGREEGREEGREALREAILRLARARFGSVSPALEQAVQEMTRENDLLAFFDQALYAQGEADVLSTP